MRVIVGCYKRKSAGAECFSSNFSVQNFLQCQTVGKQRAKELLWAATYEVTRRDCTRMFAHVRVRVIQNTSFLSHRSRSGCGDHTLWCGQNQSNARQGTVPSGYALFWIMIDKYIHTLKDQCVTKQPSLECYWERHSVCVKGGKCSGVSLTCLFVCLFVCLEQKGSPITQVGIIKVLLMIRAQDGILG